MAEVGGEAGVGRPCERCAGVWEAEMLASVGRSRLMLSKALSSMMPFSSRASSSCEEEGY